MSLSLPAAERGLDFRDRRVDAYASRTRGHSQARPHDNEAQGADRIDIDPAFSEGRHEHRIGGQRDRGVYAAHGSLEDFVPAHDAQFAVGGFDERGQTFHPVAVVAVHDAVDVANFGLVDVAADDAVEAAALGLPRERFLESA